MLLNWIICRPICHEAKGLTGNPTGQNDKSDPSLVVFSVSQANSRPQYLQITAARHCRGVEYEKLCRGGYNYLTSRFKQNVIYQIFGCRDTNLCTHTHTITYQGTLRRLLQRLYSSPRVGQAARLLADFTIHHSLGPFFKTPITGLHLIDQGASYSLSDIN